MSPAARNTAARKRPRRSPVRRAPERGTRRFVILTGLSGAGKSHAIRALEDLGYFCIDNLPIALIQTIAELAAREEGGMQKVALVVDVREGARLSELPRIYQRLRGTAGVEPMLIFLEASQAALLRRFSETRRPHPLAPDRSVREGIREEQKRLDPIRSVADLILDTSNLTVHELRNVFMQLSRDGGDKEMVVNLVSFGFKHGVPLDADLVFDVRCLPNPHFVDRLRKLTGRDQPVIRFMRRHPETRAFIERLSTFLTFALPQYVKEGKSYLTVAIGCTGGRHRSVMVAEALKRPLSAVEGVTVRVAHRDS
ncbi:MAG: RNase adapter RapZ [Acidobacteria bacterium]|nr:RNase adapter RapZ [Acidobacteriota bacterium]